MSSRAQWLLVAAVVALLGGATWGYARLGGMAPRIGVGTPAPDFRATTIDGSGAVKGIADYRGQVVLVNLWATWCGPCIVEMPSIQRLYDRYRDAGLKVVAVAVDDPPFAQRVRDFVTERGFTFEVLHEGSGAIEQAYRSQGIPATYLIGRDGRIRKLQLGAADWDSPANRAVVARLLGVAPVADTLAAATP